MPRFNNPKSVGLTGFAQEQVTVSNSAVGLTSATYAPGAAGNAERAFITCHQAAVRYMYHGSNPTSTTGHVLQDGGFIILENQHQIDKFKAIRAGDTDAILEVTYERV